MDRDGQICGMLICFSDYSGTFHQCKTDGYMQPIIPARNMGSGEVLSHATDIGSFIV